MKNLLKRCGACKEYKPITSFTKHQRTKDGLNYACCVCSRRSRAISYIKNIEREKAYNAANRDHINAVRQKWRAKDDVREREKAARHLDYYSNKEKWSERHKQWCRQNKAANRRHANLRRARLQQVQVIDFTPELLAERWKYYGNKCWICRRPATETDHVKPVSKGGAHMLCNFRPICKSCNCSKHDRWPYTVAAA